MLNLCSAIPCNDIIACSVLYLIAHCAVKTVIFAFLQIDLMLAITEKQTLQWGLE